MRSVDAAMRGRSSSGAGRTAGASALRLLSTVAVAVAAAWGATGCGGSNTTTGSTATSTTTAATSSSASTTGAGAAPSTTQAATSAASTAAGTSAPSGSTSPGTALGVGTTATVPYQPNSESTPKFKLAVTVTAIEKGKLSDFNGIKLDSAEKASTPFYVKVKIANVGSGDAGGSNNPAINIEGVDSSGETQQSVTFLGDFPRCEYKEPPKPFSHGKSFEACLTFLVPGGITKAAYTGAEAYVTSPVTWK